MTDLITTVLREKLLPASLNAVAVHSVSARKEHQPIFPYTLHAHTFFEWVWCAENEALLQVDDRVLQLREGDFTLLPPGEMHTELFSPSLGAHRVLWCALYEGTLGAHLHEYTPVNHQRHLEGVAAPAPPHLHSLLGALQHEGQFRAAYHREIEAALVRALVYSLLRAFEATAHHRDNFIPGKIAVRVNHFLQQHFSKPLSLEDVARAMCVSRNYLATLYKQETGITIGQMLKKIRLDHARNMLLETDLTVLEISRAVGYASVEHFSRVFTQQEGISPGRYGKGKRTFGK